MGFQGKIINPEENFGNHKNDTAVYTESEGVTVGKRAEAQGFSTLADIIDKFKSLDGLGKTSSQNIAILLFYPVTGVKKNSIQDVYEKKNCGKDIIVLLTKIVTKIDMKDKTLKDRTNCLARYILSEFEKSNYMKYMLGKDSAKTKTLIDKQKLSNVLKYNISKEYLTYLKEILEKLFSNWKNINAVKFMYDNLDTMLHKEILRFYPKYNKRYSPYNFLQTACLLYIVIAKAVCNDDAIRINELMGEKRTFPRKIDDRYEKIKSFQADYISVIENCPEMTVARYSALMELFEKDNNCYAGSDIASIYATGKMLYSKDYSRKFKIEKDLEKAKGILKKCRECEVEEIKNNISVKSKITLDNIQSQYDLLCGNRPDGDDRIYYQISEIYKKAESTVCGDRDNYIEDLVSQLGNVENPTNPEIYFALRMLYDNQEKYEERKERTEDEISKKKELCDIVYIGESKDNAFAEAEELDKMFVMYMFEQFRLEVLTKEKIKEIFSKFNVIKLKIFNEMIEKEAAESAVMSIQNMNTADAGRLSETAELWGNINSIVKSLLNDILGK